MNEWTDNELLDAVRDGRDEAFDVLFRRHYAHACRYAASVGNPDHAQDRAAEAFARIYRLLRDGRGPDSNFRSYLLTAVRNAHVDAFRRTGPEVPTADIVEVLGDDPVADDEERVIARLDAAPAGRVFATLRPSWQQVLWRTVVLGESNQEAARHLGLTANGVGVLAFRAREGLRQAYLADLLERTGATACRAVIQHLPAYVRGKLRPGNHQRVAAHLEGCVSCSAAVLDLTTMIQDLRALVTPSIALAALGATSTAQRSGIGWAGAAKALLGALALTGTVAGVAALLDTPDRPEHPAAAVRSPVAPVISPSGPQQPRVTARPSSVAEPSLSEVPTDPVDTSSSAPVPLRPYSLTVVGTTVSGGDQVRVASIVVEVAPRDAGMLTVEASNTSDLGLSSKHLSCGALSSDGPDARISCRIKAGSEGAFLAVLTLQFADPGARVEGRFELRGDRRFSARFSASPRA